MLLQKGKAREIPSRARGKAYPIPSTQFRELLTPERYSQMIGSCSQDGILTKNFRPDFLEERREWPPQGGMEAKLWGG